MRIKSTSESGSEVSITTRGIVRTGEVLFDVTIGNRVRCMNITIETAEAFRDYLDQSIKEAKRHRENKVLGEYVRVSRGDWTYFIHPSALVNRNVDDMGHMDLLANSDFALDETGSVVKNRHGV